MPNPINEFQKDDHSIIKTAKGFEMVASAELNRELEGLKTGVVNFAMTPGGAIEHWSMSNFRNQLRVTRREKEREREAENQKIAGTTVNGIENDIVAIQKWVNNSLMTYRVFDQSGKIATRDAATGMILHIQTP